MTPRPLAGLTDRTPPSFDDSWEAELLDWTTPPPREAVIAAGDRLRRPVAETDVYDAVSDFNVANSWREAHLLPLHALRLSLHHQSKRVDPEAVVAGRIKRLSSIRKKLARTRMSLWEIQDIAGVRAIVSDMAAVHALVAKYGGGDLKHTLARQDDYIANPKSSGYRSHHLMMRFNGLGGREAFHKRSVELQIRTVHQHAWATALEAVGLMRGEDLKAGRGSPDWLRFFQIMAGEIATAEGEPGIPGVSDVLKDRRDELIELEDRLNAVETMIGYNSTIQRVKMLGGSAGGRFIIRFERSKRKVTVVPFHNRAGAMRGLTGADGEDGTETVLVEVDGIDSLAAAYPNYIMDVGLFVDQVRRSLTRAKEGRPYLGWLRYWKWRQV